MKIKNITFQMGNDFSAIMECEHCKHTGELNSGYHDAFFHNHVIPAIKCADCGEATRCESSQYVTPMTI